MCRIWWWLTAFWATSLSLPESRSAFTLRNHPDLPLPSHRCQHFVILMAAPAGRATSTCSPRQGGCFESRKSCLGALGQISFWIRFAHFSLLLFGVLEKLKPLAAPGPGHVWLAGSLWKMARWGKSPSRLKVAVFIWVAGPPAMYVNWSLSGAAAWWGSSLLCGMLPCKQISMNHHS